MMPQNKSPLVSIAMPLYNEGKYLRETLDSLVSQNYRNLEIIISDNDSSDSTQRICQEYAAKDTRIIYYRQDNNIGLGANFIYVTQQAQGKYIMYAAGHDIWSANYITESVEILEQDHSVTIAFGSLSWIDNKGNLLRKHSGWSDTRGVPPVARFFIAFWGGVTPILGVIRKNDLPIFPSAENCAGADLLALTALSLKGCFAHVVQASFFRRQNRVRENHKERLARYKNSKMKISSTKFSQLFPLAHLPLGLVKIVVHAPICIWEKICVLLLLILALPVRYLVGRHAWDEKE